MKNRFVAMHIVVVDDWKMKVLDTKLYDSRWKAFNDISHESVHFDIPENGTAIAIRKVGDFNAVEYLLDNQKYCHYWTVADIARVS